MDIFEEITSDHEQLKELLRSLADPAEHAAVLRGEVYWRIRDELVAHNKAEEKIFYAKLSQERDSRVLILGMKNEHRLGSQLLDEMEALEISSDDWMARAQVLRELVEHHLGEEESVVHPLARAGISREEARQMGEQFVILKAKLANQLQLMTGAARASSARIAGSLRP